MGAYVLRRLAWGFAVVIGVLFLLFVLFFAVTDPDDIARKALGDKVPPSVIEVWKANHGYDRPLWPWQDPGGNLLFDHYRRMLTFDFGLSDADDSPILERIRQGMGPSLSLTVPLLLLSLLVSIPLSLVVAFFRETYIDRTGVFVCVLAMSVSGLLYIIGAQFLLGKILRWFPISGFDPDPLMLPRFLAMPLLVGVLSGLGSDVRFYRTAFIEESTRDFVRTARAKGAGEVRIMTRHVLRNAMIPILTQVVMSIPFLFTGSLLLESFFGIPGLGTMTVEAINGNDFATLRVMVYISALLFIAGQLATDVAYAIADPRTPFGVMLLLAFLAGIGGGTFSGFMPSTSYFFPKRLQGTALGIQAGIGNFGVSLVQFVTPWILTFQLVASGSIGLSGPQTYTTKTGATQTIWLHNASLVWGAFIVAAAAAAWLWLRSVPVRSNFREQFDIFRDKHTWIMTVLYLMTFGTFSGLAATFPLLIRELFGKFPDAPEPLSYAFLGPLAGSTVRVLFGPLADKWGGARLTQISGAGMLASVAGLCFYLKPQSTGEFPYFVGFMLAIFFFAGIGNASTFKQIPMIFDPRRAGGVIGWTSAIAAYGPFLASTLLALVMSATGSATPFFWGIGGLFLLGTILNWYFYARNGAAKPC